MDKLAYVVWSVMINEEKTSSAMKEEAAGLNKVIGHKDQDLRVRDNDLKVIESRVTGHKDKDQDHKTVTGNKATERNNSKGQDLRDPEIKDPGLIETDRRGKGLKAIESRETDRRVIIRSKAVVSKGQNLRNNKNSI